MQALTVNHVLNKIRSRHELKSDYAICKMLDISSALVSGWRNGRSHPDERMCQKLAEAAGIDPLILAAAMQAQRSKTAEARSIWEQIAERLQLAAHGATAAIFAVAIAIGLIAASAEPASAVERPASVSATGDLYIVSSKGMAVFLALFAALTWLMPRPNRRSSYSLCAA